MSPRPDGRLASQLRPVTFALDYVSYPEGSVLISQGNTRVLCNVSIEAGVPRWMQVQNVPGGWITAEYAMLPRATHTRTPRETNGLSGRTQEIKRLIGRSLRAAVDLEKLGPRTCTVDCDVIQADGGTRTAAITGSYVALALALQRLSRAGEIPPDALRTAVAAVSVGVVAGEERLDLCYAEDSRAEVDFNVVMTAAGEFIEVQGTAEGKPFSWAHLQALLDLAQSGIEELVRLQEAAL
jgi:ribonuclease PH